MDPIHAQIPTQKPIETYETNCSNTNQTGRIHPSVYIAEINGCARVKSGRFKPINLGRGP